MTIDWEEGRAQFADMHETITDNGRRKGPSIDLDPEWDEITQLRWHAAWIEYKTGIRIYVHHGKYTINGVQIPNQYGLNIGRSSLSSAAFHENWNLLNGVLIGFEETPNHVEGR